MAPIPFGRTFFVLTLPLQWFLHLVSVCLSTCLSLSSSPPFLIHSRVIFFPLLFSCLYRVVLQWAGNIAQRFFTRYGQPHYAEENMTDFAEAFSKQLAPKLLEQVRHRCTRGSLRLIISVLFLEHSVRLGLLLYLTWYTLGRGHRWCDRIHVWLQLLFLLLRLSPSTLPRFFSFACCRHARRFHGVSSLFLFVTYGTQHVVVYRTKRPGWQGYVVCFASFVVPLFVFTPLPRPFYFPSSRRWGRRYRS